MYTELFVLKGCPACLRSGNGSEFTAKMLKQWPRDLGITAAHIEPGSPWENGDCESINSKMRDEFPNGELPGTLREAAILPDWFHSKQINSMILGKPS